MRGEVIKADGADGPGVILGDDGKRYRFSQVQVRSGAVAQPGQKVDFVDLGDEARDIYTLSAPAGAAAAAAPMAAPAAPQPSYTAQPGYNTQPGSAPQPGYNPPPGQPMPPYALPPAQKGDGLWTYYTRALTKNYVQFNGRARRAEYWGFTLFNIVIALVLVILDSTLAGVTYAASNGTGFVWPMGFIILYFLYTFLPSLAIAVRRLHDRDLSGWLLLISLIPFGGIVLFVFTLLDSLPAANKHGPSPKYGAPDPAQTFV